MIKPNLPINARNYFISNYANQSNSDIVLLYSTVDLCLKSLKECIFFSTKKIIYFPNLDLDNFNQSYNTKVMQLNRNNDLTKLATRDNSETFIIISHTKNFIKKLPPAYIFSENYFEINIGGIINCDKLINYLVQNDFVRSSTAVMPKEFAIRGEIIDIVLDLQEGYRIVLNENVIEAIKIYDVYDQTSIGNVDNFLIPPANEIILNDETIRNFKFNYLQNFGIEHSKDPMLSSIIEGKYFPGCENLLPLFYKELVNITSYLKDPIIVYDNFIKQSIFENHHSYFEFYNTNIQINKLDKENFYPVLPPGSILNNLEEIDKFLDNNNNIFFDSYDPNIFPSAIPLSSLLNDFELNLDNLKNLKAKFDFLWKFIKTNITSKKIFIFCKLKSQLEKAKNFLTSENIPFIEISKSHQGQDQLINLVLIELESGFISENALYISYTELFKISENELRPIKQNSKKKLKNILIELEGIQPGEYIIHKEHGIGQFLALENVTVEGSRHDCIKILYAENAKLYIPVENIENIKKYGYPEAELDRLGGLSWQKRKSKLKERITEVAIKILAVAATRKSQTVNPLIIDEDLYEKFCQKFQYVETEDQLNAIKEIKQDLLSGKVMDRLICGDVGFGKTEVALRAAFMVASDKSEDIPQVAIIVPTTILCKQHYIRCVERFNDTNLNIAELSRFVPKTQSKLIKENLKDGKINIIIGTHALLSKDIIFYNLKLLIIDEEQHFGVVQKERLKELKSSIHVLSLSATPIPRTLQMSMVGLKELSLITTPPVGRIPIKTIITPFDHATVKEALLNEHQQGGKSFYVVPKIKDISEVEKRIQLMVPELKYKVIHGGLPSSQIEQIMNEFYHDKIDILLSTAIIESGIDIATANTMIIHRSDQFGLSQIYQLRGRIGRGKKRAFAILTLEKNKITDKARKKLEIMHNIENSGGGFAIASHDMDFRGYGNLVGKEQAGHIKEVGIELYQEMLDEQLANLQNNNFTDKPVSFSPTINLGISVFINENYINDTSLRLGIYRRLGTLSTNSEIYNFSNEMIDRFGPLPLEFKNLLDVMRIKIFCIKLNVVSLDVSDKGMILKFDSTTEAQNIILKIIAKYGPQVKLKPNHKLAFIKNFNKSNIVNETLEALNNFCYGS